MVSEAGVAHAKPCNHALPHHKCLDLLLQHFQLDFETVRAEKASVSDAE